MPAKPKKKFSVLRDSREQEGWCWDESDSCSGTIVRGLKTGDYTLEGFEDIFVIERKAGTAELAKNINEDRFERELERLEAFRFPFLIAECTWDDVFQFPKNSGIPYAKWRYLRIRPGYLAKRLVEFELKYKTKILLAGSQAKAVATSLFKRVLENAG